MGMTAHPCPHLFLLQCPSLPCHVFVDGYDCPWCRRPHPRCRWWRLHQVLSYSLALALVWLVFAAAAAAVVASVVLVGVGSCSSSCGCHQCCLVSGSCGWCW